MKLYEGIRESYVSNGLSDDEVRAIVDIAEEMTVSDNETLIDAASNSEDIYLLLEGKLRVTTVDGAHIARLRPGDIVGELALFDRGKRSATVMSQGDARLAKISSQRFEALMDGQPTIGMQVLRNIGKTLCQRLRSSNIQLESVLRREGF